MPLLLRNATPGWCHTVPPHDGEELADEQLRGILEGSAATTLAWAKLESVIVPHAPGTRVLYVKEGEAALNVDPATFDYVGTDDATTCHALLVQDRASLRVGVCHIDSPERCEGLREILSSLGEALDVHVLGGLLADPLSLDVLLCLLLEMHYSRALCHLQALCVQHLNHDAARSTPERPFPALYGAGFCRSSPCSAGVFSPDSLGVGVAPMQFPLSTRGPCSLLRRCACFQPDAGPALDVVYDGSLASPRFRLVYRPSAADPETVEYLLELDDHALLEASSTSPHCEPSHFAQQVREVLEFFRDPGALERSFQGKGVLEFVCSADGGGWTAVP